MAAHGMGIITGKNVHFGMVWIFGFSDFQCAIANLLDKKEESLFMFPGVKAVGFADYFFEAFIVNMADF
jgi:hypothetical protein